MGMSNEKLVLLVVRSRDVQPKLVQHAGMSDQNLSNLLFMVRISISTFYPPEAPPGGQYGRHLVAR